LTKYRLPFILHQQIQWASHWRAFYKITYINNRMKVSQDSVLKHFTCK